MSIRGLHAVAPPVTMPPSGCPESCVGVSNNPTCCPYQYQNPLIANDPNAQYTTPAEEMNLQAYADAYQAAGSPPYGSTAFNALTALYFPADSGPSMATASTTSPIPTSPTPNNQSSVLSNLASLPWYYYAGGAALLFALFSGGGSNRH
jgi:hypothetical protein